MKPILFNTEMVRAILDGRKTVTRRVVKSQFQSIVPDKKQRKPLSFLADTEWVKPPYQPGDILYVRETWRPIEASYPPGHCTIEYKAGGTNEFDEVIAVPQHITPWRPSIHMPKKAARIFLRVTNVRAERLQDITEGQAIAEGVFLDSPDFIPTYHYSKDKCNIPGQGWGTARECFRWAIWNGTVKPTDLDRYGWYANPWVWVIQFDRISKEELNEQS